MLHQEEEEEGTTSRRQLYHNTYPTPFHLPVQYKALAYHIGCVLGYKEQALALDLVGHTQQELDMCLQQVDMQQHCYHQALSESRA